MTKTKKSPAFALGSSSSVFCGTFANSAFAPRCERVGARQAQDVRHVRPVMMAEKKGFFQNLFGGGSGDAKPASTFTEPQAGDPGYTAPPPLEKGTGMTKSPPRPSKDSLTSKLPVAVGEAAQSAKRGLQLLREDLFKTAPEKVGVGRQDKTFIMKPQYGDPGYQPQAYETIKYSELGISSFTDDANSVTKVGGLEAVKEAAKDAKKGRSAAELKAKALKKEVKAEAKIYDIPDYLKPIPEDTPRRGLSWKNYKGR